MEFKDDLELKNGLESKDRLELNDALEITDALELKVFWISAWFEHYIDLCIGFPWVWFLTQVITRKYALYI